MIYILAVIGIVFWITNTEMLSKLKNKLISLHPIFYKLFSCPFCMGFHVGIILGLFFIQLKLIIPFAFASGISTLVVFSVLNYLEKLNEKES